MLLAARNQAMLAVSLLASFAMSDAANAYSSQALDACSEELSAGDVAVRLEVDGWKNTGKSTPVSKRILLRDGLIAVFAGGKTDPIDYAALRKEAGTFIGHFTNRYSVQGRGRIYLVPDESEAVLYVTDWRNDEGINVVQCLFAGAIDPKTFAFLQVMLLKNEEAMAPHKSDDIEAVALSRQVVGDNKRNSTLILHLGRFTTEEPPGFGRAPKVEMGFISVLSSSRMR